MRPFGDDFPKINHDSRVRETSEVVIKFTQINKYIYIYVYIHISESSINLHGNMAMENPPMIDEFPFQPLFTYQGFPSQPRASHDPTEATSMSHHFTVPNWTPGDFSPGADSKKTNWRLPGLVNVYITNWKIHENPPMLAHAI